MKKKKKLIKNKVIPMGKDTPQRLRIFNRDNGKCKYCGSVLTIKTMTLDHKIPKSKGGVNTDDNLFACCYNCNMLKANMNIETFTRMLSKGKWKNKYGNNFKYSN